MKLFLVLKVSGLNGSLKGYLKLRISKLPKKEKFNFLLANVDLLKIAVSYFLFFYDNTCLQKPIA